MMECALALLVMMDVSGSVTEANWRAQRDGTANAFRDPAVTRLISQQEGGVAIATVAWGSRAHTVVQWRIIRDEEQAADFADRLAAVQRPEQGQTDLAGAMRAAAVSFEMTPCQPWRRVADISGDGPANAGDPSAAKAQLVEMGVVVNGLPIITNAEPQLEAYYRSTVITEGGFLVAAQGWEEFGQAIRRKLTIEVAARE